MVKALLIIPQTYLVLIKSVLMKRDGLTETDAIDRIEKARQYEKNTNKNYGQDHSQLPDGVAIASD